MMVVLTMVLTTGFCRYIQYEIVYPQLYYLSSEFLGNLGRDNVIANNTNGQSILQIHSQEIMVSLSTLVSMAMKEDWDTFFG